MPANKTPSCRTGSTDAIAGSIEQCIEAAVVSEGVCIEHHESHRYLDTQSSALEIKQQRSSSTDWKLGCFNISPTTRTGIIRIRYGTY